MSISPYKIILTIFLFTGIFLFFLLADFSGFSLTLLTMSAFVLFFYVDIYVHEIGHALMGWLMGFQIKRMMIGSGRELFRFKLAGFVLIITNSLSGGVTHWGKVPGGSLKPRFALLIMGGIFAQIAAILLCMAILDISFRDVFVVRSISYPKLFIYSNLLLITVNLIPLKFNYMGIKLPTDGMQLLKLPLWKDRDIQNILSAGKIMDAYEQYELKNYDTAEELFRECVKAYPDVILPRINLAAALIKQGKVRDCIEVLEADIISYQKDPLLFFLYNNLAWAYLILYKTDTLQKADEYSGKAYLLNARHRNVLGTRGCVLIEKGAVEDGLVLLKKVVNFYAPVDDRLNDPVGFMYLAYAYYLQGKYGEVLRCLKKLENFSLAFDQDFIIVNKHVLKKTNQFSLVYVPEKTKILTSLQGNLD